MSISSPCFKDHHQDKKKDLLDRNLHFAQKSGPILINDPQIGTKLSAVFSRFLQFGCLRHTNLWSFDKHKSCFFDKHKSCLFSNYTNLTQSYIVISGKRMETNSWECDNCQKVSSNAFWYPKTLDQPIMLTITKITISILMLATTTIKTSNTDDPQFCASFSTEAGDNWRAM